METIIYIYTIFSDWKDLQTLYKLSQVIFKTWDMLFVHYHQKKPYM